MIGGYAKGMPPNAPNMVEILASRFPADLTPLLNDMESKKPLDAGSARTRIAEIINTILAACRTQLSINWDFKHPITYQ